MALSDYILYRLAKRWPSPKAAEYRKFGAAPGTDEYGLAYARNQFQGKALVGIPTEIIDKDVLEIGCGHGGITCFIALMGGRAVGIDINVKNLQYAQQFARHIGERFGRDYRLDATFCEMDANQLSFPDRSFDVVIADNVFEHLMAPNVVLSEIQRVLRPGGILLVPAFSSIISKYGLHLKHGLKIPWANLFFTEKAIIRAMQRLAKEDHRLYELYPGLLDNPTAVRDLRPYKDLNNITYGKFQHLSHQAGFEIIQFTPRTVSPIGRLIASAPVLRRTRLVDILSKSAFAKLRKPGP